MKGTANAMNKELLQAKRCCVKSYTFKPPPGTGSPHKPGPQPPRKDGLLKKSHNPKVQRAFSVPKGTVPRTVEVDRYRRRFVADDVGQVLETVHGLSAEALLPGGEFKRGVAPLGASDSDPPFLALEIFDDTEFDIRTPEEWMSTGREDNEEATMRGIPAFTLQPHAKTGRMAWVSCTVLKYAEERKVYKALVDGRATAVEVPRVYLMFAAEDPRNFAKRVAAAHKYRADTEAAVMYSLTVDCIPAHGHGVKVSQKRIEEIFRKSSNGTSFKLDSQVAQRLVAEINLIHSRSLNKMILDAAIEADPDAFPGVVVPKAEPKPRGWHRHDEKSRPLESFSFDAKVAMIQKKIMHNHIDVLAAIDAVRATCEPIEAPSMSLFATKLVKSVTLEEFQTMQSQASESVKNFISNAWVPDVQKAVVESIGNYGKGWFNMQEQSLEIYEVSKLKQFMRLTRLIMQDALRTITLNSAAVHCKHVCFRDWEPGALYDWLHGCIDGIHLWAVVDSWDVATVQNIVNVLQEALGFDLRVAKQENYWLVSHSSTLHQSFQIFAPFRHSVVFG
eukprot:gene23578-31403_t